MSLARRDVEFGLAFTLDHFDTRALQERALEILKFKLDVLWQMSDAMALRYMECRYERRVRSMRRRGPPSSAVSGCNGRRRRMRTCSSIRKGMIKLNGSAGEIMKRCDGATTIADITADLERAFSATELCPTTSCASSPWRWRSNGCRSAS